MVQVAPRSRDSATWAPLGRRAVVAHVGDQGAVVAKREGGLDVAAADDRLAHRPGVAAVVAVRGGSEAETVRVEPQKQPLAPFGKRQDDRMGAGEPPEAAGQLVGRLLQIAGRPLPGRLRCGRIPGVGEAEAPEVLVRPLRHQVVEAVAGLHVKHVLPLPHRRPRSLEVRRDLELHQRAFPEIRLDRRPEQPQPVTARGDRLEQEGAVRVREAGRVGEQETARSRQCHRPGGGRP